MPTDLTNFRERINAIDSELVRLLDERATIAREVGRTKAEEGLNTYDPGRAKGVMQRVCDLSNGAFPHDGLVHVFREVLSACLNLQKPLRVGYLGPSATFSHQAAIREFGSSVVFESFDSIRDLFANQAKGWIDHAVVPVENSTGGIIHETLDSFLDFESCRICGEILLPIHHALIGMGEIAKVRRIYSHRQTFLQCGQWLREHLPEAELVEVSSTVKGMQMAKRLKNSAAIGSEIAADEYGLRVMARGIEDNQDNTTRFLVIANTDSRPSGEDKTSLMFSVNDRPGALFLLLKIFADKGLNLSKIESRPTKRRAWEYVFFADLGGHRTEPRNAEAIAELQQHCAMIRILGSYPSDRSEFRG